jgi:cytochrome c oxidase subunit 2
MLLRVYVDTHAAFDRWIAEQSRSAQLNETVSSGRRIFEKTSCINCHTIAGTSANGRFGPDLTHVMSRDTIGSGVIPNTPANLRRWIRNPDDIKPGSRMPAMNLNDQELDAVTAYLASLH